VTVSDQAFVIAVVIFLASVAIFFVARFLLDRGTDRSLALVSSDGDRDDAAAPPDLAARVDRSFHGLVYHSGLGLSMGQTLWFIAMTAGALAALLYFWSGEEGAAVVGLALGLGLALLVFWILQARRRRLFQGQLPDAFYFLARSLRAGLSLEQALTRAGEQLDEPLAGEFRRCARQIQLGLHPQRALRNMAARLDLADFDIFVSTVGLYYHGGGNLALLLDRLAASARDRVQFLGYFRAATALGRAAGFVLAAAVPVIVIAYALLRPEHVGVLFDTTAGWQILGIAALLEIIGVIWFLFLLRVEY
jgi:tight adherence protein B